MFDFVDEIKEMKNQLKSYRYVNYGGETVVVQGYKDLLFFDENNVVLKLKEGELSVSGNNLRVVEFSTNSIKIFGKIIKMEVEGVNYEKLR